MAAKPTVVSADRRRIGLDDIVGQISLNHTLAMSTTILSPLTQEVLRLLGASVKTHRLRRRWSIDELARRVGVSHPTIMKIERADPTVAIGTVMEAAALVGVPLFDVDPVVRARHEHGLRTELFLLPKAGRRSDVKADDDF